MKRLTIPRIARLIVIATVIAITVNSVVWAIADWHLADMRVYQDAALRLRHGEPLYGGEVDSLSAYRYAPWFAYAWIPLTYLPQSVIDVGWSAFLLAGSAVAIRAGLHAAGGSGFVVAILMAGILFGISAIGNIQGPMLALLMVGIPRRWGGVAVGIAASLKLVPFVLTLAFLAQRRWWQAAIAAATAGLLWLPAVFMSIDPVTLDPGAARTLPPIAWMAVAACAGAVAAWAAWRRWPHAPLVAAVAAVLAIPRLFVYEISLVWVGTLELQRADGSAGPTERAVAVDPPGPSG